MIVSKKKFGKLPAGKRLQRVQQSPNYRNGKFYNQNRTPQFTNGANYFSLLKDYFLSKSKRSEPKGIIPSQSTDLHQLNREEDVVVWFGHSSYFLQVGGKRILVDPVFSGSASPIKGTNTSYKGADVYGTDDIPELDLLIITHDHWDHLDFDTVTRLQPKVNHVVTSLGVGEHLEFWGYPADQIHEADWHESITLTDDFTIHVRPSRHFSGRWLTRQPTLWSSFVLQIGDKKIYVGGDSGYDEHFAQIGEEHGPIDLALLECGQYNTSWHHIHMMPEETVKAGQDLKATKVMPVHWAKFTMALHAWDDSIKRVTTAAEKAGVPLVTPMIGEKVHIHEERAFDPWWEGVES